MKQRRIKYAILIYLGIYFIANLLFLDKYPFMHSDESWLSGLSRAMMSGGPGVTEPFFDLFPRYPHAIKSLYHIIQMPFILIFGYNLFAVRLISLIFGTALLYVFYRLAKLLSGSDIKALVITVLLSLDVQFIYSAHFARQDIIIAFAIIAAIYYILRNADDWRGRRDIVSGVFIGLTIGVHPNSFIVALAAGSLYLYLIFMKKLRWTNLLRLVGVVALFAALFIGVSYIMDSNFIQDYMKTGENIGVSMTMADRINAFPQYFANLFEGVTGTYYIPPLKLPFIVFGVGIIAAAVYSIFNREMLKLLLPIAAVCAGILIIGRYSQPGIIMVFPLCWLLVFYVADKILGKYAWVPALIAVANVIVNTVFAVVPYMNNDYDEYITKIEETVPSESCVLANLNCEYAFEEGALLDYRNLEYLNGMTFEEYMQSRDVEYIIYPEEMDYIYQNRPVWNVLYGNVWPYYDNMQSFLSSSCTLVSEFKSPYAMRITWYMHSRDWTVKIYKVNGEGEV